MTSGPTSEQIHVQVWILHLLSPQPLWKCIATDNCLFLCLSQFFESRFRCDIHTAHKRIKAKILWVNLTNPYIDAFVTVSNLEYSIKNSSRPFFLVIVIYPGWPPSCVFTWRFMGLMLFLFLLFLPLLWRKCKYSERNAMKSSFFVIYNNLNLKMKSIMR